MPSDGGVTGTGRIHLDGHFDTAAYRSGYRYHSVSIQRKEQGDRGSFIGWGELPVVPTAAPGGGRVPAPSARRARPAAGAERRTGGAGREWHGRGRRPVRCAGGPGGPSPRL